MTDNCVIIGASHASAQLVASLRQMGWEGGITLIGDEPNLPYHRPPLSKGYLSGSKSSEELLIRPQSTYEAADVILKLSTRAAQINRKAKTVALSSGEEIAYSKLVLATGARARKLLIEGGDLEGVYYLRDMQDVSLIKTAVSRSKKAVIIGGGYIGLETAASLRQLGVEVTILEAMPRILQRVTAPQLSEFYKRIHTEEGVHICENVMAASIAASKDGLVVRDKEENSYQADFIIVGIGVIPNVELAQDAGLKVSDGVEVNQYCQTTDPDIYAAGDVTLHHNEIYDRYMRLESVPNATEQAKIVAAHLCGQVKPYNSLPWFWSDQYDLKLQIAGLSRGYDSLIIRGDIQSGRSFAAFYFKENRLLAVDAVNSPREFAMTRMLLTKGKSFDKTKLSDPALALKEIVV